MLNEKIKSCLITGGNGYLGKHILDYLNSLGWDVKTLGLRDINLYQCDLRTQIPQLNNKFDTVIHCAGKAHVFPNSTKEEQDFFDVNVRGTRNLLAALEACRELPKAIVFLSSVSVYGLDEGELIKEDNPIQSKYAYGQSKIDAEKLLVEWCGEHNVRCAILRVPLLAGKNPPGNLKNMISSIKKGYYFNVSGTVQKSMVLAYDVAKIIPASLAIGGVYNLTDGHHPLVKDLANVIAKQLDKPRPLTVPVLVFQILLFFAKIFSPFFPKETFKLQKLATTLTFDDSKARTMLGWNPDKVLDKFIIK